jgi:hypothetical protein
MSQMKKCNHCGREIPETAKVCGYCGTKQVMQSTPEPPPPQPEHEKKVEEQALPQQPSVVESSAPEPVKKPEFARAEKQPKPKRAGGGAPKWLAALGFVLLAAVVLLVVWKFALAPEVPPQVPDPVPTDTQEENQNAEPTQAQATEPVQEDEVGETLSQIFGNLELVRELDLTDLDPAAGDMFEQISGGKLRVYGGGRDQNDNIIWGSYYLVHDLSDHDLVFVRYRYSEDANFTNSMQNDLDFQAPGYRAWGWYRRPDNDAALLFVDDEILMVADFPGAAPDEDVWYEVFIGIESGDKVIIREESPDGFQTYYPQDGIGTEFVGNTWRFQIAVAEGWVEIEQVLIFTFDDVNLP